MKTLVCLLSAQPVPNLISCKALNPDFILLVETTSMKKNSSAENFCKALKCFGISSKAQVIAVPKGHDNFYAGLKECFQREILDAFPDHQFYVNLTGGTKPMSIAMHEVFREKNNATLCYIDTDFPQKIMNFRTGELLFTEQISRDAFLSSYGYQILGKLKNLKKAETLALERREVTRVLAMHCNLDKGEYIWIDETPKASEEEQKAFQQKSEKIQAWINTLGKHASEIPDGYLCPSSPEVAEVLCNHFGLKQRKNGSLEGTLTREQVRYLNGVWLEEFVWGVLDSMREKYQIYDLNLGLMIQKDEAANELDVSFMHNNRFHIIECKTGFQQDRMVDNAYKVFSVRNQIRANGVLTYLISNSSSSIKKVEDRAKLQRTTLLNAEDIYKLATEPETVLDKYFKQN